MALQTKTIHEYLTQTPVSLHGLRFRTLVSVDETQRPPGGGVAPEVIGPLDSASYVLDVETGTIRRADGLDPVWARVGYEWDDAADPAQEAYDAEISDLAQSIATAITWLQAIQDDATAGTTQATADITTATTGETVVVGNITAAQTQIRALYTLARRSAQRETKIIEACDRLAVIVRRMLKLVSRQLAGTPV